MGSKLCKHKPHTTRDHHVYHRILRLDVCCGFMMVELLPWTKEEQDGAMSGFDQVSILLKSFSAFPSQLNPINHRRYVEISDAIRSILEWLQIERGDV